MRQYVLIHIALGWLSVYTQIVRSFYSPFYIPTKWLPRSVGTEKYMMRMASVQTFFDTMNGTSISATETEDQAVERIMEESKLSVSKKVEVLMENNMDVQAGVMPARTKPMKVKANIDMWTYQARQQLLKGNFKEARELYERCTEYDPVDGRAWGGLSKIHWKTNRADLAEGSYKSGLYYEPTNPYLLQSYAVMLEKLGRMSEAISLLKRSVKSNPYHSASWTALASLTKRLGRINEARGYLETAISNNVNDHVSMQMLGVLENDAGRYDEARGWYQRAIKANPRSVWAYQSWATLEKKQGNYEDAKNLLLKALEVYPKSTMARGALAEIRGLEGDTAGAREEFRFGQKQAASLGDAGFFQTWAMFEWRLVEATLEFDRDRGDKKDSEDKKDNKGNMDSDANAAADNQAAMAGAQKPVPKSMLDSEENIVTLGISMTPSQKAACETVRAIFRRALIVNKKHSASWVAWAKFERRLGQPEIARKLLIAGITKFPHSRDASWFHSALGNLLWREGDFETARACYIRALDSCPNHRSFDVLLDMAGLEGELYCTLCGIACNPGRSRLTDIALSRADIVDSVSSTLTGSISSTFSDAISSANNQKKPLLKEKLIQSSGKNARQLYERLVYRFPRSERAWAEYISFEEAISSIVERNQAAVTDETYREVYRAYTSDLYMDTDTYEMSPRGALTTLMKRRDAALIADMSESDQGNDSKARGISPVRNKAGFNSNSMVIPTRGSAGSYDNASRSRDDSEGDDYESFYQESFASPKAI